MKNSASGPKKAVSPRPVPFRYSTALEAIARGQRAYSSPVRGSLMVQIMLRVGSAIKGSSQALVGSGTIIMSDSLMAFQPRMLEPSKATPALKLSSSIWLLCRVRCCQMPGMSINFRSINSMPSSSMRFRMSAGVAMNDSLSINTSINTINQTLRLQTLVQRPQLTSTILERGVSPFCITDYSLSGKADKSQRADHDVL